MTRAAADLGTISSVRAEAYTVPTDAPESDGALAWNSTTILVVHVVHVGGGWVKALGYSYTDASAAALVNGVLADVAHPGVRLGQRGIGRPDHRHARQPLREVSLDLDHMPVEPHQCDADALASATRHHLRASGSPARAGRAGPISRRPWRPQPRAGRAVRC